MSDIPTQGPAPTELPVQSLDEIDAGINAAATAVIDNITTGTDTDDTTRELFGGSNEQDPAKREAVFNAIQRNSGVLGLKVREPANRVGEADSTEVIEPQAPELTAQDENLDSSLINESASNEYWGRIIEAIRETNEYTPDQIEKIVLGMLYSVNTEKDHRSIIDIKIEALNERILGERLKQLQEKASAMLKPAGDSPIVSDPQTPEITETTVTSAE